MAELRSRFGDSGISRAFLLLLEELGPEIIDAAPNAWFLQKRPRYFGADMVIFKNYLRLSK